MVSQRLLSIAAVLLLDAFSAAAQEPRALVSLAVNRVVKGTVLVYVRSADVWVQTSDLRAAGLPDLGGRLEVIAGDQHVSLASLAPGITFELDEVAVELRLTVQPDLLERTTIELRTPRPPGLLFQSSPSAFFNYAVNVEDLQRVSVSSEAGISVRGALFHSSFTRDAEGRMSRGFTSLTFDSRTSLRRWTIGDVFAAGGDLGGSVGLAGVSVSRNFSLDPYFVRYPAPSYTSAALTPTSVEIYVNDTLVRREELPPGPFELRNLPVPSGHSSARLILRDAFGRREEVVLPMYFTPRLLAKGLSEYSYNVGFRRRRTVVGDDDYGPPVLLGSHRAGVTDSLTAGLRVEATRDLFNGGGSISVRLPVGELEMMAAASRTPGDGGQSGSMAYTYMGSPVSFTTIARVSSERYANLGRVHIPPPRVEASASANVLVHPRASLTLQYAYADGRDWNHRSRMSAQASVRVLRHATLLASVTRSEEPSRRAGWESLASLSWYLGRNTSASAAWRNYRGASTATVDVQKPLPVGNGAGYQLRAQGEQLDAQLQYNTPIGRYEGRFARVDGKDHSTLRLSGGVVGIGGKMFLSRPVQDAFALVRVPGVARVRGYASNQEVGATDDDGDLLIPNLLSNYGNPLKIARDDVPLDHSIAVEERVVAPPYRGGAVVVFPVERVQRLTGHVLVDVDGVTVLPALGQLTVEIAGAIAESPLGDDAAFYLENVPAGRHPARVEFERGTCRFELDVPKSLRAEVDLGELRCAAWSAR